jgi:hypothetical protein
VKSRFILVPLAFVSVLGLAACEEQKPADTSTTPAPTATSVAISDEDLAVQADFEEDAERSITASNYKTELDSLEKELEGS